MLILIDGYNVIAPVAAPGKNPASDWLHRERMRLIDRLATHLEPRLAAQTCVVFDATTRARRALRIDGSSPSTFRRQGVEVRFAVDHDEADDLIEELVAIHSSPKRLTVVSSDHRLQAAARRSGALAFDSQPWFDALLDGKCLLAIPWPPIDRDSLGRDIEGDLDVGSEKAGDLDGTTVDQWMQAFATSKDVDDAKRACAPNRHRPTKPKDTEKQPSRSINKREKPGKASRQAPPSSGDPKPMIPLENPFPEGYGEDLL